VLRQVIVQPESSPAVDAVLAAVGVGATNENDESKPPNLLLIAARAATQNVRVPIHYASSLTVVTYATVLPDRDADIHYLLVQRRLQQD
jgi:hypothetical protein